MRRERQHAVTESDDAKAGLARHRAAIDALDQEILERLNARAAHAQAIGAIKGHGVAYRPEREAQVLARLQVGEPRTAVERGGRRRVPPGDVGLPRARADAADRLPRSRRHVLPTTRSPAISGSSSKRCRARRSTRCSAPAESGQTDHAVVPVENSSEGAIGRTLDLMCQTPLTICGEIRLRIRQNLLSTATTIGDIAKVYSHAQSLAQCAQWLAQHLPGAARVAVVSNAEAARLAAAEPGSAAIAGENAAAIYGLNVVAPHIEDEPNNTTRFWVLGRQPVPPSGRDETSLVMSAPNRPGAVHSLLEPFATHGVSMSRFESRPARTGLWEYLFFVDVIGHETDAARGGRACRASQKSPYAQAVRIVSFSDLLGVYMSAIAGSPSRGRPLAARPGVRAQSRPVRAGKADRASLPASSA